MSCRRLVVLCLVGVSSATILQIPGYGTLQGGTAQSFYTRREFDCFRTLYYAKKPTNLTRFLPPIPVDPLPDGVVYDAITSKGACPQPYGDENCLFLNVFTPKLPNRTNSEGAADLLPVIYFIHGGGFSEGGAIIYSPSKFMDQDVVFVEVQYRLGPLGFLSLNTDEVPGNAGIFDQIEGLRWVQKFIKYFGGDPSCVTIMGESAGSASVSLLTMAPQARGLFHRAIGESGSMLPRWALDREPVKHALQVAERAGCPLTPYADLLYCLRNIPPDVLSRAFVLYEFDDRKRGGLGFGASSPVIQVAGHQRVLEQEPIEILKSGNYSVDIPMMLGTNRQEGALVLAYMYKDYLTTNRLQNDTQFLKHGVVPAILNALGVADDTGALADALTFKYLAKAEMGNWETMIPGLIDLCSVLFLKAATYETIVLHSRFNPNAFWYSFDFEGRYSLYFYIFFGEWPPIPHGVNHADEMLYLFSYPVYLNETEVSLSKRMLKVWTTFAKYGNPTPDGVEMMEGIPTFPRFTETDEQYMSIDSTWQVKRDFTKTYTVTADGQSPAGRPLAATRVESNSPFGSLIMSVYKATLMKVTLILGILKQFFL